MTLTLRVLFPMKHLLNTIPRSEWDREVIRITADSRQVIPGTVFVAIRGAHTDGHAYLQEAEKRGAILAVIEEAYPVETLTLPVLRVASSRRTLAECAATFFGHPSRSLKMVGVTGTSGKTTTTYLLEAILTAAGHQVGVIGTVNARYGTQPFPTEGTTPGPLQLQSLLSQMLKAGCTTVVMEVSSHALKQHRVDATAYDALGFTNLSPEHLDYHSDMEDYFQSKARLFREIAYESSQQGKSPVAVIGLSSNAASYGHRLFQELLIQEDGHKKVFRRVCGAEQLIPFHWDVHGITGSLDGVNIQSSLVGQFNAENITLAIQLALSMGISKLAIERGLSNLKVVPGRLERVENSQGIHVWVDYAHKVDALSKVLSTLQALQGGHRLLTVFGCGGDRDRQKRPQMGQVAVEKSSHVWVTSDNPRTENPETILHEIIQGIPEDKNTHYSVEIDRRQAIFQAIDAAQKGDLVLIAGKGHENYQLIGTQKIHFDDREIAQQALLKKLNLTQPFKDL